MRTVIIPLRMHGFPPETTEILDAFGISMDEFLHFVVDSFSFWECESDVRQSRIDWFLRQHNDDNRHDYPVSTGWYSWQTTITELESLALDITNQMNPYLMELGTQGNRWSYLTLLRTIGPDLVLRITPPLEAAYYHA
jgi:hypothetical protein